MLHKAWNSKGEVPYCFPKSSIKFQGHTGQNIIAFDPNWAFPDYRPVAAFKSLRFALFCFLTLVALLTLSCYLIHFTRQKNMFLFLYTGTTQQLSSCWKKRTRSSCIYNDIIKWKHFSALLVLCEGNHRSPVCPPHKCQCHKALMFSLMYACTNDWANIPDVGGLRHHGSHCDATVMLHVQYPTIAGNLVTHGTRETAAMVLTLLSRNIHHQKDWQASLKNGRRFFFN